MERGRAVVVVLVVVAILVLGAGVAGYVVLEERGFFLPKAELRVLTPEGGGIGNARLLSPDDPGAPHLTGLFGEAEFRLPAEGAVYTVTAIGRRTASVAITRETSEVVLEPGIRVSLSVPDDLPLPDPPRFLVVELTNPAEDGIYREGDLVGLQRPRDRWEAENPQLRFEPDRRTLDLLLPRAGAWRIDWSACRVKERKTATSLSMTSYGHQPAIEEPQVIEILDRDAPQDFTLEIDRAKLEEALAGTR